MCTFRLRVAAVVVVCKLVVVVFVVVVDDASLRSSAAAAVVVSVDDVTLLGNTRRTVTLLTRKSMHLQGGAKTTGPRTNVHTETNSSSLITLSKLEKNCP